MHIPTQERGYTLIVVVVLLAVLLVAGTAAIRMAQSDVEASKARTRADAVAECAQATRELLLSQLRFGREIPPNFELFLTDKGPRRPPPGTQTAPSAGERIILRMGSGHAPGATEVHKALGGADPGCDPSNPNPPAHCGKRGIINDEVLGKGRSQTLHAALTNDIAAGQSSGGAVFYSRCLDEKGRAFELEFVVRHGI